MRSRRSGLARYWLSLAVAPVITPLLAPLLPAAFLASIAPHASAQQLQPQSESLMMNAQRAFTWSEGKTNIVQLEGPVTIQLDRATMTARNAILWLTPIQSSVLDQQQVEIALIGEAKLTQAGVERSGERLFVSALVRGDIRLTAEERIVRNRSDTDLYRDAAFIRPFARPGEGVPPSEFLLQRPWLDLPPEQLPATQPATQPLRPSPPVSFRADNVDTVTLPDGKLAVVLAGDVLLTRQEGNAFMELQADRAVLFTPLTNLRQIGEASQFRKIEDAVESAYLEGDVRINHTQPGAGEQRLRAQRVFYEFTTDRAVLTDAVLHTMEPTRQIPVTVRANVLRQLSLGEWRAQGAELSTSNFAVPSYSIRADRAYVRQYETGDPRLGSRTTFSARDTTFNAFGVPFFYLPVAGGSLTERGSALRELQLGGSRGFGAGVRSEWGLYETFGKVPPDELDLTYRLDYFAERGPATGFNAEYSGGFITETTKEPWNFEGRFTSYLAYDQGEDRLGQDRAKVYAPGEAPPNRPERDNDLRGRFLWEHQHFLPDHWQVQLRGGYASDPTFLEEWFERDFNEGQGHDLSIYAKRQVDTEALTLLLKYSPNDFVTSADLMQEQFNIEKLPEIGYHRVGDSLGSSDQFTFFSANTFSAVQFDPSGASLFEQGFFSGQTPGIPSLGRTGVNDNVTFRADSRQEIDWPVQLGQFKAVPYLMGRYTGYTDSPANDNPQRLLAGTGVRIGTAFWKVDDSARSELLDIHRLRHVVEPELHLFASAATEDQSDVLIYDEPIDAVNDVVAAQLALRQRWQTKRGGPGRWRSVDFFVLNIEANAFANQPEDFLLEPQGFRGLFFQSMPEASIPRNSINADALWRLSDTTVLLGDVQQNLDENELATASVGLAAQRDRLAYFLGTRYIGQINSTIASVAANYELSAKYQLGFGTSFDLSENESQNTNFTVVRRFDRFFMTFGVYYDAVDREGGFNVGIYPEGFGYGLTTNQFDRVFAE